MTILTQLNPLQWSTLPDIDDVDPLCEEDEAWEYVHFCHLLNANFDDSGQNKNTDSHQDQHIFND